MMVFIKYTFSFALIIIFMNIAGRKIYGPHIGDEMYIKKLRYNEKADPNMIFIGSSKTSYQVIPKIVDDIVGVNSFNLGSPATANPELYKRAEIFINTEKNKSVTHIVLEITCIMSYIGYADRTPKQYYWFGLREFTYIINYLLDEPISMLWAGEMFYPYLEIFAHHLFNMNYTGDLSYILRETVPYEITKGYIAQDLYLAETEWNRFKKWRKVFLERVETGKGIERPTDTAAPIVNSTHLKYLNKINKLANKHNIKLFFLIPPRLNSYEYAHVQKLIKYLNSDQVIDVSSPKLYPRLYDLDVSFDHRHLNDKGARMFSKIVAEKLKNLM